ncbi:MAG: T9SS type A sorting domain-containing protein [Flavobacteriales bacterium]|nr:T9SS type A sorting domain-containing protein [Flavobacteriales bacterium]
MRTIVLLIFIMNCVHLCAQTFNERLSFYYNSLETGMVCLEAQDHYLFMGGFYDSLGIPHSGVIATDYGGGVIHNSIVFNDSTIYMTGYYTSATLLEDGVLSCGLFTTPPYDFTAGMLIKLDLLGDTLWTKIIPPIDGEELFPAEAFKVSDGYVVCGGSVSADGVGKGLLMKFDEDGNEVWRQDYLPTSNESPIRLVSAVEIPGGGFLLGGATMAAFNWNHLVIKTDSLGNQIWRKTEGDEFSNSFAMVANTADGKYIFAGEDQNAEQFHDRSQVTKLNTNGTVAWTYYYGEEGPDCLAFSIKALDDGGFVFCGGDRSAWGTAFGYICRIDQNGNELWYRKYQQTAGNECFATDVSPTSDGGFIMTGLLTSNSNLNLPQDMWAIKLDSMGCLIPGCQVGIIEKGEVAAMRVYPNPADDFINVFVESQQVGDCALHLYDLQGRELQCTTVRESGNTWMMDSATLSPGTYLLQLLVDGAVVKSEKVVVRH